jgi:cysteine desulfurase
VTEAYLDHACGGIIDPRVREAMQALVTQIPASAHGLHRWAEASNSAIEDARASVAELVGAEPSWVIFTAGPTEARNLAVKGALAANRRLGTGILTSIADHPATLSVCRSATRETGGPTFAPIDLDGRVDIQGLREQDWSDTALVCLTQAQPEIGTIQPLAELVAAVRGSRAGTIIHVDAGDSVGLCPISMRELDVDLLTIGGSSLGAPPWTGALVVRPGTRLYPLVEGGIQEHGKRAGAEDVPSISGFGQAAETAATEGADTVRRVRTLGQSLMARLVAVPDVRLLGPSDGRLPGHVSVAAARVEAQTLVLALAEQGVAASPGSACTAVTRRISPVLEAIGVEPPWTHSAVLFTLGSGTTPEEVEYGAEVFARCVASLREFSPIRVDE